MMAEGGRSITEGHTPIADGSEFVFDFYCEVCRDDDKHLEAAGFCVDCGEYLCETCVTSHKRARPSRYHNIQDQSEMPTDTPLSQDRVIKTINKRCEAHPGETIKFYCHGHKVFGCTTCFATVHKTCTSYDNILEKSETIDDSCEFTAFSQSINELKKGMSSIVERADDDLSETNRCRLEAVKEIKQFRKTINNVLDDIEQGLITRAEDILTAEKENKEIIEHKISDLSDKIAVIETEIKELQTSRRVCHLYIYLKEMKSEVEAMQCSLSCMQPRMHPSFFCFGPNHELVSFLKTANNFGAFSFLDICVVWDNEEEDVTISTLSNIDDTVSNIDI